MARRDDREYLEYLSEEQRSQRGCIARRMQLEFHHGLLGPRPHRYHGTTTVAYDVDHRATLALSRLNEMVVQARGDTGNDTHA